MQYVVANISAFNCLACRWSNRTIQFENGFIFINLERRNTYSEGLTVYA